MSSRATVDKISEKWESLGYSKLDEIVKDVWEENLKGASVKQIETLISDIISIRSRTTGVLRYHLTTSIIRHANQLLRKKKTSISREAIYLNPQH